MEKLVEILDLFFGCHHGQLSRVFTIEGVSYRVCCNCAMKFDYSLEEMSMGSRLYGTGAPAPSRDQSPAGTQVAI